MDWKERLKVCKIQASANKRFPSGFVDGVKLKDENGNILRVNQTIKTDWEKELQIAKLKT